MKACYRLAARLKGYFPRLPIMVLLDGLYPNGPLMALCRQYHWQFMIVLPTKCLPSVWEEVHALKPSQAQHRPSWRDRQQPFWWVNDLTYHYARKSLSVHGVGCEEHWPAVDPDRGALVEHQTQPVWLSSQRLNPRNVQERGNRGARRRWGIETSRQIEKRPGYRYEHAFSHDWNAMKGYH